MSDEVLLFEAFLSLSARFRFRSFVGMVKEAPFLLFRASVVFIFIFMVSVKSAILRQGAFSTKAV